MTRSARSASGCPVAPLLPCFPGRSQRGMWGWLASTSVAALLITGVAALAMSIQPAGESMGEEAAPLMVMLPPSPAVEAMTEPAPEVSEEVPEEQAEAPVEDVAPDAPELTEAPDVPDLPEMTEAPADDAPVADIPPPPPQVADVSIRPKARPERPEEPEPVKKAEVKPKKVEKKTAKAKPTEKPPEKKKAAAAAASSSAASKPASGAASAGSGKVSAATYGAQVMKKVKKTKQKRISAKGVAVVAFTISDNGGLAGVSIARSSGSAELDQVALDHIRRSAPFPAPPPGVGRSYSFEFLGR
ncbi:energy transducer TonB family protein [Neotabrizicola sp. VNH66]|uniref:energy transducer TonB family protein n=1 Tax=Neotabrizicola sp. VNH66 TaxID=3400918 RepID=UPI003C0BD11E